jgi:hypothetical protein
MGNIIKIIVSIVLGFVTGMAAQEFLFRIYEIQPGIGVNTTGIDIASGIIGFVSIFGYLKAFGVFKKD